jgi:hypothetical protein
LIINTIDCSLAGFSVTYNITPGRWRYEQTTLINSYFIAATGIMAECGVV